MTVQEVLQTLEKLHYHQLLIDDHLTQLYGEIAVNEPVKECIELTVGARAIVDALRQRIATEGVK